MPGSVADLTKDLEIIFISLVKILKVMECPTVSAMPTKRPRISSSSSASKDR